MLGWSSEAGNPNIQDLKRKLAKAEREKPPGTLFWNALICNLQEQLSGDVTEERFALLQADFSGRSVQLEAKVQQLN